MSTEAKAIGVAAMSEARSTDMDVRVQTAAAANHVAGALGPERPRSPHDGHVTLRPHVPAANPPDTSPSSKTPPSSSGPTGLHSPPESNSAANLDNSDSELSDLEDVDDTLTSLHGDKHDQSQSSPSPQSAPNSDPGSSPDPLEGLVPDHYSGTVPVFKPTMDQFQDFVRFMEKVDSYGMKSGIIKIIPPDEWKQALPDYGDAVKQIRVREPIKQEIMGSNGTYRQVNLVHQRIYNLPQWRQLCDQSEHQPPARRGERRANADKQRPATRARTAVMPTSGASRSTPAPGKKRRGRPPRRPLKVIKDEPEDVDDQPMTPVSPAPEKEEPPSLTQSVEHDPGLPDDEQGGQCEDAADAADSPIVRRMAFSRQAKPKTQSTSARRKYVRRENSAKIDESAFQDWDYRMDVSSYTPERCEELERTYWKTLTYASPLYGADLLGTLFGESTNIWNLNNLPNLLDVLGTKVPGVNTAYLYLGMWKATFAWHLEDVDLYSINYLHFGAPKQWYSISQGDARRFEAAMKSIWPTEAKACQQFLRHKAFLISPAHLKQHYNITVNKCVSYPGEFVVTYPYGYHSGYNLGYNCAEAVNFALDSWLPMGKIAKKCQCAQAQDSVWVDVYEIERKLRGEETEYEESEEEDDDDDDDDDEDEAEDDEDNDGVPLLSSQIKIKIKEPRRKRKRMTDAKEDRPRIKKARLRLREQAPSPPCCLCPNDVPWAELLPTDDGREAHRMCALYLPETWVETVGDKEVVANAGGIDKARLDLKCLFCRSKKGACFQCSQKRCPRSYHATCAAAAGVFVDEAEVPVFSEDGTEYKELAFDFSCRFHRAKRDKKFEGPALEETDRIMQAASAIQKNSICQMQYYRGDIFAGLVLENSQDEQTLLVQIIPNGDRVEVEWKWLLLPDASDLRLPKASANALPMPTSRKAKQEINAKRLVDELPKKDDEFGEGLVWAEFHSNDTVENGDQVKTDLAGENQVWYYLPKTSTETRAQYTEDPARPQHNTKSNFLASIPKPPKPVVAPKPRVSSSSSLPVPVHGVTPTARVVVKSDKPYVYKPRKPVNSDVDMRIPTYEFMPQLQNPPGLQQGYPQHAHYAGHTPALPLPSAQGLEHGFLPQYQQSQKNHLPPQQEQQVGFHSKYIGSKLPGLSGASTLGASPGQRAKHTLLPPHPSSFGTDTRFTGSPVPTLISSDRFAPVGGSNGFPQLHGLTGPPAHMKSGQISQSHARGAWSSATPVAPASSPTTSLGYARPGPLPMPFSETKLAVSEHLPAASSRNQGQQQQPQENAYQKYSFYQVHHNRDPARYRTPYSTWGGFTNGYQGSPQDVRGNAPRHSVTSQQARHVERFPPTLAEPWLKRCMATSPASIASTPWPSTQDSGETVQGPLPSPFAPRTALGGLGSEQGPLSSDSAARHRTAYSSTSPTPSSTSLYGTTQAGLAPLHPAIRPQFNAMWQKQDVPPTWSGSTSLQRHLPALNMSGQGAPNKPNVDSYQSPFEPFEPGEAKVSPCTEHQHPLRTAIAGADVSRSTVTPPTYSRPDQQVQGQSRGHCQEQDRRQKQGNVPSAATASELDYADMPADSTSLVEQMLLNLKRASAMEMSG